MRGRVFFISILALPVLLAAAPFTAFPIFNGKKLYGPSSPPDNPNVVFRLLNAGGGQPSIPNNGILCPVWSAMGLLSGNYFCLNGDGTTATAVGVTLQQGNTTTTVSSRVCPNGANCDSLTAQQYDGGALNWNTGSVASPAGSLSCWALFRAKDCVAAQTLVAKDDVGSNRVVDLSFETTNCGVQFRIFDNVAGNTVVTAGTGVQGGLHLAVGTYKFVTNGTSEVRGYLDGVAGTPSTTAGGPLHVTSSSAFQIGDWQGATPRPMRGDIFNAGCTETLLSAAQITQMSNAALATPLSGSWGEALTFTRATASSCPDDSGGITILPGGRPCVTQGGVRMRPLITNLALRSTELDNAAWISSNMTITANETDTAAPDHTLTADTLTSSAANGTLLQQGQTGGGAATGSFWIRRRTGTGTINVTLDNGATYSALALCPSGAMTISSNFQRGCITQTITALATPVNAAFTTGAGTLTTATYYYRVAATNALGVTPASTETSLAVTGPVGINVNWGAVTGATGYKVYGRTTGAELLIATVGAVTTYLDDGSVTPSGALPTRNSSGDHGLGWKIVTSGDAVDVYGAQIVTGSVASDFCPTYSTAAACNPEYLVATKPSSMSATDGCVRVCVIPTWTGNSPAGQRYFVDSDCSNFNQCLVFTNGAEQLFRVYDGTHMLTVSAAYSTGVPICARSWWSASANQLGIENQNTGASTTSAFTTFGAFHNIGLGSPTVTSGNGQSVGEVYDVQIGTSYLGCRQ